jgi:hypothetical protein
MGMPLLGGSGRKGKRELLAEAGRGSKAVDGREQRKGTRVGTFAGQGKRGDVALDEGSRDVVEVQKELREMIWRDWRDRRRASKKGRLGWATSTGTGVGLLAGRGRRAVDAGALLNKRLELVLGSRVRKVGRVLDERFEREEGQEREREQEARRFERDPKCIGAAVAADEEVPSSAV